MEISGVQRSVVERARSRRRNPTNNASAYSEFSLL
jgi:hypothetical protein